MTNARYTAERPYTCAVRVTHNAFHVAPEPATTVLAAGDSMLSGSQGSSSSFVSNMMASTIRPQTPTTPPSKLASLQEFVDHHRDASEMGFSRSAPPHLVGGTGGVWDSARLNMLCFACWVEFLCVLCKRR